VANAWLLIVTKYMVFAIDVMVLVAIGIGSFEAFFAILRMMFVPSARKLERPDVWLRFARWLVVGLTFQLAADVLETSVTLSWEELGRLCVIAMIRTFLNFFLERDLADVQRGDERPSVIEASNTASAEPVEVET
jgi:uncharacterized membrane protein